ncbi:hypothetical protein FGSG_12052 [Fusarium graminearum PH-1]|uniref:hypothetical protein n=1 Tax=Gibberella zeae (strain ATCC MYA-4620 / CBS 123657 / FGSC 9075 / NRRL 31084 / PH-1) TaxID=229533 RepID=UPI00021F1A53|nr:hypothetical protein FGSG_12052 [Fusarium graminearum PH-1]ESU07378.1 hypothetical protein FGSG_12052 [Fusarium graminearum PH-1]|eukprot:XP_011317863.1 hypothetical protein FGSG_12052 [Fusarium graminearum PH-1]
MFQSPSSHFFRDTLKTNKAMFEIICQNITAKFDGVRFQVFFVAAMAFYSVINKFNTDAMVHVGSVFKQKRDNVIVAKVGSPMESSDLVAKVQGIPCVQE